VKKMADAVSKRLLQFSSGTFVFLGLYLSSLYSYLFFCIRDHSDATFSHGICPDCVKKPYPEL